jgi:diguanylate cyclase (GGDEF)-like protein
MPRHLHQSLGTRLSAVLALAFGLILAASAFGFHRFHAAALHAHALQLQWSPRIEILRELRLQTERAALTGTRALQTPNFRHQAQIAAENRATETAIDTLVLRYRNAADTERERELLDAFTAAWSTWREGHGAVQRHIETGDMRRATAAYEDARARAHSPATGVIVALLDLAEEAGHEAELRAAQVFRAALALALAAAALAVVLAIVAILWVRRYVAAPLTELSRDLHRLAAGDLEAPTTRIDRSDEIGALAKVVAGYRDSLARGRDLAHAAEQQRERLRVAVANMPVGLCMTDAAGAVVVSNDRFEETFALDPARLRPGAAPQVPEGAARASGVAGGARTQVVSIENERVVRVVEQALPDGGWVAIHEDITAQRAAEARIAHMAHHDALTGLPNRIRLRESLERALQQARRGTPAALLYLDLDRFKAVNDTLGHPVGDALLQAVAQRLSAELRPTDTVARLGGDEFAALVETRGGMADAAALARRIVVALSAPYEIMGQQVVIGTSVGIAVLPEDGEDPDALLRNADLALYRAKADGRGTWRFFEPEMTVRAQARRTLELDLRRALAQGEFVLWYQPIVRLPGRAIRGFEALLRWQHPDRGMLPPSEFLGLAEEVGLMVPIGEWVMRQACKDAAQWPGTTSVAVNISAAQCASRSLVDLVDDALARSGLAPSRLRIEITEAAVLKDSPVVMANLRSLKGRGIGLAMDDFGTGSASISHLRRFPFDMVKIDGGSQDSAGEGGEGAAATRAIAALCRSLGFAVAAEGIETEDQLAAVEEVCSLGQGYLFGRPMPGAEVLKTLGIGRPGGHLAVIAA